MFNNRIWMVIATGLAWSLQGAEPPVEHDVDVTAVTVTADPEPMPVLKYLLLPSVSEQTKGNAALFYYGAVGLMPDTDDALSDKLKQWIEQPAETLPRKEVDAVLATYEKSFHQLRLAAQRDHCDWDTPVEEGYDLELPSLPAFRQLVRVWGLKSRLDMADRHFLTALQDVRHMLAMSRNMAAGPTLIQDLVGMAIARIALRTLTGWSRDAQTPNLYWALSMLPQPFIDIRQSMEMEQSLVFKEFPDLKDLERETLSVAQANALTADVLSKIGENLADNQTVRSLIPAAWTMMQYSDAQAFLQARQWSPERIKALPVAQTVLLYQVEQYREIRDQMVCWLFLPYADAYARLKEAERSLSNQYAKGFKANVFLYFMPALYRIGHLQCRLDREIAMLRIVEALRLEAAHNGGHFPQTLADISRVPIPRDPLSGHPFIYHCPDPHHARLEAPPHPEETKNRPVFALTLNP